VKGEKVRGEKVRNVRGERRGENPPYPPFVKGE